MRRSVSGISGLAVALGLCVITLCPAPASAQGLLLPAVQKVNWFGPFGISPNDTARFVYTNLGADTVQIQWAFTNAESGELVCGNFGKPVAVAPGQGRIWDYSQTLTVDVYTGQTIETRNCDGASETTDELYFDAKRRHELVGWIFIQHSSRRGLNNAVDLPTVEIFNSLLLPAVDEAGRPDPSGKLVPSMTFGRTLDVIHANPTAPAELPKALQR